MLHADVVRDPASAAGVRPGIVQVGVAEIQVGVDPEDADIFGERADDRRREAVLAADDDRNLPRADDVGGPLGDARDHVDGGTVRRGIAEVGDGDVEQVPLVIHHVGLEVVRGFPDRTRCEPRPAAEGAGVIVGHAEQGDAGGVVLRDGVREVGRGHPEAATAWAYLRTRPLNSSSAGGGRASPCT